MWALSIVIVLESLAIRVGLKVTANTAWIIVVGGVTAFLGSFQARIAAEQWGEWVKASFDIFLPAMRKKLGYTKLKNLNEERDCWLTFSQATAFSHPQSLSKLESYRDRLAESQDRGGSAEVPSTEGDDSD